MTDTPSDSELAALEREAARLAALAGAEIESALGRARTVRYKGGEGPDSELRSPVSEVDHHVETVVRADLADSLPDHDIVGEEFEEGAERGADFVWAIDPVDGTTNFINGYPMFSASIGVLHRGRPVAGAIWCSTSHALRHGVYHARAGGPLQFDSEPLAYAPNPQVRRRLAGLPRGAADLPNWDARRIGSAAIECAFAAAGLLEVVRLDPLNIWDVAAGACLARSAGCTVMHKADPGGWTELQRFDPPAGGPIRAWRGELMVGRPEAVAAMLELEGGA